jgi:hypothetical protein
MLAPALAAIELQEYEFPNGFYQQDQYRGRPTQEKDAAWSALWSSKESYDRAGLVFTTNLDSGRHCDP